MSVVNIYFAKENLFPIFSVIIDRSLHPNLVHIFVSFTKKMTIDSNRTIFAVIMNRNDT